MNNSKKQLILNWTNGFKFSKNLILAFENVKRENFIPTKFAEIAYEDGPLPIGEGQTISQPTTVMIMLDLLEIKATDKIFEIGCGSGYNAALMAEIAKKGRIITAEIVKSLAEKAKERLNNYKNITVLSDDGVKIAKDYGPFDKIIITAALKEFPQILIEELNEGGIMIAPIGDRFMQTMIKLKKINGEIESSEHGNFMFVPLQGEYGF